MALRQSVEYLAGMHKGFKVGHDGHLKSSYAHWQRFRFQHHRKLYRALVVLLTDYACFVRFAVLNIIWVALRRRDQIGPGLNTCTDTRIHSPRHEFMVT